jgi:hypothetical protein
VQATQQALEIRLKDIESRFRLANLFGNRSGKHKTVRQRVVELSRLGLIRPFLLEQLLKVRNEAVHDDKPPASSELCQLFLEIVWYFLRSTDLLFMREENEFLLAPGAGNPQTALHRLEVQTGPTVKWSVEVSGWLPPQLHDSSERKGWINLREAVVERVDVMDERRRRKAREAAAASGGMTPRQYPERDPFDLHIQGVVAGPKETILRFAQLFFKAKWNPCPI